MEGTPQANFLWDLGETYLLADRLEDARDVAQRVLTLASGRGQRHYEGWALHLLGAVAARRDAADHAEHHYRQSLALAEELGMQPLAACCHLGLGTLYRRIGKRDRSQAHLATAATMCRDMGMMSRLEQELRPLS